ncbi:MAG: hypothetical protein ACI8WW_001608, partial [Oceanospirillaceae bacterium]
KCKRNVCLELRTPNTIFYGKKLLKITNLERKASTLT